MLELYPAHNTLAKRLDVATAERDNDRLQMTCKH